MRNYILLALALLFFFQALPASAAPDYPNIYQFYMELGKLALKQGNYREAYTNFRHAQAVAPGESKPKFFINIIKRMQDNRIEAPPATRVFHPFKKTRTQIIDEALDEQSRILTRQPVRRVPPRTAIPEEQRSPPYESRRSRGTPQEKIVSQTKVPSKSPELVKPSEIVYLDDALWATQPGTTLRVELRSSIILEGANIQRYLIITPDFIQVGQIDKDHINIAADRRGSTFLHVWDDSGRWTFNVEVILPVRKAGSTAAGEKDTSQARPFKMTYLADWGSFYRGSTFPSMKRENLSFLQRVLLSGETPYGDFDSHVIFNKFDESTEVTGYGAALTNGHIGDFKDFSLYGFDIQKVFSPLTMPGQYVRGVLFEAKAFNKNLAYSYIHGRDRYVYGLLSPDVLEERESFVEGARITLFPEKENQYSINYARGYGNARESFLKDQVVSVQAQHRVKDVLVSGEFAYDESAQAKTAGWLYDEGEHKVNVQFRDIEKDFTTVTSYPGNRGEVGGSVFWDWQLSSINIDTYLDLYKERLMPNPGATEAVNIDFNTRLNIPMSKADRLLASLYYTDTPGELSPRNNIRTNATYTKRLRLGDRDLTAFVGATQQRSRYDLSTSSDYDRYSASAGFALPLWKSLSYYTNYEYSWVYEEQSGDQLRPNVFNAGLNYARSLGNNWSVRSNFSYRNEENTQGNNSFLAGEDNITGSLGATFRPSEDFELFVEGRARNVWAEEADRAAYNEVDVRTGVRTSWDFPFSWNPKGTVEGIVYKDINGNQRQDYDEIGIPDITVKIGDRMVKTNIVGYYRGTVRAKTAEVSIDLNSVPEGFIFSTPVAVDIQIIPHKVQAVDFGLTTQSGIYGIVFFDANNSGQPDDGDEFVAKVRIMLDGKQAAVSDFEGTYAFDNVQPGAHILEMDLNSLPIEYLPKIKLKNTIETAEGSTYVFHIPLNKTESAEGE